MDKSKGGFLVVDVITGWLGQWEVEITYKDGSVEATGLKNNYLTDAGLNMLRDILSGAITDGEIKYVAFGSDGTTTTDGTTRLGNEQFRKLVTSQSNLTGAGKLQTICFVADTEANGFTTEEIGWFAGSGASGTANSGVLVARVNYHRAKTNLESWRIRRVDTIGRS